MVLLASWKVGQNIIELLYLRRPWEMGFTVVGLDTLSYVSNCVFN